MQVGHDPDRHRDEREGVSVAAPIRHFDVPAQGVLKVVVIQGTLVEQSDDGFAIEQRLVGVEAGHKVVTADVARKGRLVPYRRRSFQQNMGCEFDDLVTPHKSVVIVEGFEVVQIHPGNRQRLVGVGDPLVSAWVRLTTALTLATSSPTSNGLVM